jgi:hypothetical protein
MKHPSLEIEILVDQLADIVEDLELATQRRATAETEFKLHMAKSRVSHKILEKASDKHAEDLALIDCEQQFMELQVAQAQESAIRDKVKLLQARLDGCRSLAVAIRSNG